MSNASEKSLTRRVRISFLSENLALNLMIKERGNHFSKHIFTCNCPEVPISAI
jgi:hypothetical protein